MREYAGIREKIIHCSEYGVKSRYIEIDLIPNTEPAQRTTRRKKINVSEPKQKNLNNKRAVRYLNQLIKTNFTSEDYKLDLSYKTKFKPKDEKEMVRMIKNYIDRVNRERAKLGLDKAKYICVNEHGKKHGRIHHHLLISGGLDRDIMEKLWCDRKRKGVKERELLGYVNCDRLQFSKSGLDGLVNYITKDMARNDVTDGQITIEDFLNENTRAKGKRRWMQSKNLKKPWSFPPNDRKYTRSQIEKIVRMPSDCENVRNMFERIYRGYELDECKYEYNDTIGRWSIYLKMHLIS